jgi:hypothetical protein
MRDRAAYVSGHILSVHPRSPRAGLGQQRLLLHDKPVPLDVIQRRFPELFNLRL